MKLNLDIPRFDVPRQKLELKRAAKFLRRLVSRRPTTFLAECRIGEEIKHVTYTMRIIVSDIRGVRFQG